MLHAKKPTKKAVYKSDRRLPKLKCPSCNARLLDAASVDVKRGTQLFEYSGKENVRFIIKCRSCDMCVGIDFKG